MADKPLKKTTTRRTTKSEPPVRKRRKDPNIFSIQNISVNIDYDDVILIRFYLPMEDVEQGRMDSYAFRLEPTAALSLMRDLVNAVSSAARMWAQAIFIGDCDECGNTRLVAGQETRGGSYTERVRCPKCIDRFRLAYGDNGFPPRPRIGGGER